MGVKDIGLSFKWDPKTYYYRYSWLQLFRPMTLTGTISPILVGTGFAFLEGTIQFDLLMLLLIAAILIQSATNVLNDYYDFKSGQDKEKWISGEEKGTIYGINHRTLPYLAALLIGLAVVFGLWLAISTTMWIAIVGIIGILAGIKYSAGDRSFASIGMGEVIAALFLGPVVTILAYFVQTNTINWQIIILSLVFASLIVSMILTNNIRDFKKDIGFRKTLAFRLGRRKAISLLSVLLVFPYVIVITLLLFKILPLSVLFVLFASPFAFKLLHGFRPTASREEEIIGMKWAARHHWVFGLLFAAGLWLFL